MWVLGTGGETAAKGSSIGDSSASRTVYFIVVLLVLIAAGLVWFSLQYWRRTRPGSEAVFERAQRRPATDRGRARVRDRGREPDLDLERPSGRASTREPGPARSIRPRPSLFDDEESASSPDRRPRSSDPRIDPRIDPRVEPRRPRPEPRPEPRREASPERAASSRARSDRRVRRDNGADLSGLLEDDPNAYRRGPAVRRSSDPPRDPLL